MIARAGCGWQTVLADLSLILFMATAAALSQAEAEGAGKGMDRDAVAASPQSGPLAFYRVEGGAPTLGQWLDGEAADRRQVLTIVAQYAHDGRDAALAEAATLAREVGDRGVAVRIVVEPGAGGTTASLAYDDPRATMEAGRATRMARGLHHGDRATPPRKDTR